MRRVVPWLLLLALAGCEAGADWLGVRHIRELPADEARRRVEAGEARFAQAASHRGLAPLPYAELVREDEVPAALRANPGWTLVVDAEAREALRLAARLVRAGVPRVAVVRGAPAELAALTKIDTASRGPLQPRGDGEHRIE